MDLTFQVHKQYCSLQHWTLLLSPITSTTGCCFCFASTSSFFLELFLHWSPVAYWAPIDLGSSSFSVLSFCLFILFMGFSRQEYWSGLPFPSPMDHILSDLSIMAHPSWVALWSMWLGWLVFCDYDFSLSALWCPLSAPTILLGFLLPWTWGISSQLLQHSAAAAPLSHLQFIFWNISLTSPLEIVFSQVLGLYGVWSKSCCGCLCVC